MTLFAVSEAPAKRDKETEELKAELERLRAAAGEKNPENEDGGNT